MKKILVFGLLVSFGIFNTGCTYLSYKSTQKAILSERIEASGDAEKTRLLRAGVDPQKIIATKVFQDADGKPVGAAVGVDIANTTMVEVLQKDTWRHLIAGIGDAVVVYQGAKYISDYVNDDDKAPASRTANSGGGNGGNTSGNDTIVVQGDGNIVTTGGGLSSALDGVNADGSDPAIVPQQ